MGMRKRDILISRAPSQIVIDAINTLSDYEIDNLVWFVRHDTNEFDGVGIVESDGTWYKPADVDKLNALDIIESAIREELKRTGWPTR